MRSRLKLKLLLFQVGILISPVTIRLYMCMGGRIGTNSHTQFARHSPNSRLYLNTENPADYNGTVTEWSFCYYRPSTRNTNNQHLTGFAVYRLNGTQYEKISETLTTNIPNDQLETTDVFFACDVFYPNLSVIVQVGDVLGACIRDLGNANTDELNILGRAATGFTLLQSQTDLCDESLSGEAELILPSYVLSDNLEVANSNILHLFGNISTLNDSDQTALATLTSAAPSMPLIINTGVTNPTKQATVETNSNRLIIIVVGTTSASLVTLLTFIVIILLLVVCLYKTWRTVYKEQAQKSFRRTRNNEASTSYRNDVSLTYNAAYFASPALQASSGSHPVDTIVNEAYVSSELSYMN